MAVKEEMIIEIAPDGSLKISIKGNQGDEIHLDAKALANSLGDIIETQDSLVKKSKVSEVAKRKIRSNAR